MILIITHHWRNLFRCNFRQNAWSWWDVVFGEIIIKSIKSRHKKQSGHWRFLVRFLHVRCTAHRFSRDSVRDRVSACCHWGQPTSTIKCGTRLDGSVIRSRLYRIQVKQVICLFNFILTDFARAVRDLWHCNEPMDKSPKIAIVDNPALIWGPRQEELPRECAHAPYISRESLAYIFCW